MGPSINYFIITIVLTIFINLYLNKISIYDYVYHYTRYIIPANVPIIEKG